MKTASRVSPPILGVLKGSGLPFLQHRDGQPLRLTEGLVEAAGGLLVEAADFNEVIVLSILNAEGFESLDDGLLVSRGDGGCGLLATHIASVTCRSWMVSLLAEMTIRCE